MGLWRNLRDFFKGYSAVVLLATLPGLAVAEYKRNAYTALLDYYEPAVNVSSMPRLNTENTFTKKNTFPTICFADATCQITAGVASSTISVNAAQFDGNGGAATPLSAKTSVFTLQGNDISISGLKTRVDNLDTSTATLFGKFAAVAVDTTTIANNLVSENSARVSTDNSIIASTGAIKAQTDAIAVSTGVLTVAVADKASLSADNTWSKYNTFSGTAAVTGYQVNAGTTIFTGPVYAQTRLVYSNGVPVDYYSSLKYPDWVLASGTGSTLNSNNIKVKDNNYATSSGVSSNYVTLAEGTFGFAIPSTATIVGVKVAVGRYQDSGGTADDTLCLMIANVQSNYCKASAAIPTSRADPEYGGAYDMWNTVPYGDAPLTPAVVNSSGFGVVDSIVWQAGQTGSKNVYTDYYSITVYYASEDYFSSGYDLSSSSSSFNVKRKQQVLMSVSSASVVYAAGFSAANYGTEDAAPVSIKTGNSERVRVSANGGLRPYSRTMAQLLAITPAEEGETYYCSNCSPKKLVVSTGTAAGNFAAADGGTFQ